MKFRFFWAMPLVLLSLPSLSAAPAEVALEYKERVVKFWTKANRDAAIPRDLVVDERGLGYLKKRGGELVPHGHSVAALSPVAKGKPSSGCNDTAAPVISEMSPDGTSASSEGASITFSARVTDDCGLKSVSFVIIYPNGVTQSFTPDTAGSDIWSAGLNGFTDGNWGWQVIAKDSGPRGGRTTTSSVTSFTVDTSTGDSGGSGGSDTGGAGSSDNVVVNELWPSSAEAAANELVQSATGRIYFMMPTNKRKTRMSGYVCSGSVVEDGVTGRSLILTAAHCVYDDVSKSFAENVLFIPNQHDTSAGGTDTNCSNDPLGCWVTAFGVIDENWTTTTFPNNIPWDYAFYVVNDVGAHEGNTMTAEALDVATGALPLSFATPELAERSYALGYSYNDDPNFMYCADTMTTEGEANWWLGSCGLSGGASGGPWIQPATVDAAGQPVMQPVISVNSWGYSTTPGMAGPLLNSGASSAIDLYQLARDSELGIETDWQDGYIFRP